jgi:hypothetical protein
MSSWYWRDGTLALGSAVPLDDTVWKEQMRKINEKLGDMEYKVVKQETLPDGKWISTVWLGLDHSHMGTPPLIFETMVFESRGSMKDLDQDRYSTEIEALAGHEAMKAKWESGNIEET